MATQDKTLRSVSVALQAHLVLFEQRFRHSLSKASKDFNRDVEDAKSAEYSEMNIVDGLSSSSEYEEKEKNQRHRERSQSRRGRRGYQEAME